MLDRGRLDENAAVEVGQHDFGASLGAIDAEKAEVLRADGLNSWMNDSPRLMENVRTCLATLCRCESNIPHAAMSETSSNCWKLSVISVFSRSAWVVESPSMVSSMAPRKSAKVGWYRP